MDEQLEVLIAICGSLARHFEAYAKNTNTIEPWPKEMRKAASHLEHAIQAMERHECRQHGRRNRMARDVTDRLMGSLSAEGVSDEVDDEVLPPNLENAGLRGTSKTIPIPDLLDFLKNHCKTGVLRVVLETETLLIEIDNGEIIHAQSDNSPKETRLGEVLIQQGALSEKKLKKFLVRHGNSKQRLGEALQNEELVTSAQLRAALEYQIQQLFHRLFTAEGSQFFFTEEDVRPSDAKLRLNVTSLLLESARVLDEAQNKSSAA
jgi:hypothetical protein